MTTVQELSVLHRRYADISHRFRAGWTFHQFLQSLGKTLLQRVEDQHSTEFQNLYTGLKEISQSLNASESERIRHRLEAIDRRLTELIGSLDEEDTKVTPDLLRQFFRRVKNYDEKILTQLIRFYLYAHVGGPWPSERLDKIDFLLARLSEEVDDRTGELALRDHHRLTEIFQGIWGQLGEAPPGDQLIEERRAAIDAVRHEMGGVESLDGLNESGLIRRYRELKHGLGNFYFHPELLLPIMETNLVFKSRIQKLYRQEEQRIVAEYQRVFELEREIPFDTQLDRELAEFREEIERFEKQLQKEEFRLGDIAQIRQKVRQLLPRLTAGRPATAERASVSRIGQDTGEHALSRAADAASSPLSSHEELLGDYYRRLVDALRDVNPPDLPPERVVLRPEVFALRIEPREVEAYRRVFGKAETDRELEQFLLESAALRIRINEEAHEIASLLDETSVTGDAVVFARARLTCRSADSYVWRFNHVLHDLMMSGNMAECRQVQLLRMRLMRDYSGLWLLAFKPLYKRLPAGTLA
ncbi:MAG TPA: hypothetical protein VGH73_06220 [Thermoanaerobaculia bacterium]|jgi:hypothetical protein